MPQHRKCFLLPHLGPPLLGNEHVVTVEVPVLQPLLVEVPHAARHVFDDLVSDGGREALSLLLVGEECPQRPSLHQVRHDRQLRRRRNRAVNGRHTMFCSNGFQQKKAG